VIKKYLSSKKTTHLVINLKNECNGTLKYIGCTIEFAYKQTMSLILSFNIN